MPAPQQYLGRPDVQRLPSGLLRITRYLKVTGDGVKAANIGTTLPAYGTADAEYSDAFLIEQSVQRIAPQATDQTIALVFQQLAEAALTATNDSTESTTFDGRRVKRLSYLCKVAQADGLKGAVGTVDGNGKLFQVDVQKGPVVAVVTRFYIENTAAGFVLSDQTDYQNNGKLTVRTIRTVASAAATPSGYTATGTSESNQDGYTVYTSSFARGNGVISQEVEKREGTLEITNRVTLVPAADADPAEPANLISRQERDADGYRVFTDRFISAGSGQSSYVERTRSDGSSEVTIVEIGATQTVPSTPAGYYAVAKRHDPQAGGYYQNQGTFIKPPADRTFKKQVNFSMPGVAYVGGGLLVLDPPISRTVLADVSVSFANAQLSTTPYSVSRYAGYHEAYKRSEDGVVVTNQRGLGGYVGDSSYLLAGTGTFNGVPVDYANATVTASSPNARPLGSTVLSVDNDIYLVDLSGTVIYRREVATYTF